MEFGDFARFDGFGPNPFDPFQKSETLAEIEGRTRKTLRKRLKGACPDVPGVYGMIDDAGQLIYVGKSKQLRTRLRSYFSPRAAHEKAGRIVRNARKIVWETAPNEFAALLRELQLIRQWRPRWNVQGQPSKHQPSYICVGRGPAEHVYLTSRPAADARCFGPIYANRRARLAAEVLTKHLRLRDCSLEQPMAFAEDLGLFQLDRRPGCLRYELKTCLGPCVAGCSRTDYYRQVRRALAFLSGESDEVLQQLREKMRASAVAQNFERAARLRDTVASLEWLCDRLARLRAARADYSFVYPVWGQHSPPVWFLITRGNVVGAIAAPRHRRSAQSTLRKLQAWHSETQAVEGSTGTFAQASLLLVVSWFTKFPQELEATLTFERAVERCEELCAGSQRVVTAS